MQAKHKSKMLSLGEMIEKSLLLRESASATLFPNPDATPKALLGSNSLPKASIERSNQANLVYFDAQFNKVHGKSELMSIKKDVYYRNIVFFIQHL